MSLSTNAVDREREGLVARATQSLREALLHGSFRPGAKLTLREVARELGTSVTPVREAVAKLVADGALEARAGYSARVPILSAERYEELLRIRIVLEGFAASAASERFQKRDIRELANLLGTLRKARKSHSWQEYLRLNKEFRFAVYERSGMTMLVELIERLWLQAAPYFSLLYPPCPGDPDLEQVYEELLAALARGDGPGAGEAIRKAIRQGSIDRSQRDMLIKREPRRRAPPAPAIKHVAKTERSGQS